MTPTPTCFGRYILLDRIAKGGMGEIYVAVARGVWGLDKLFAIKKILPSLSTDPEFMTRFQDEARLVIPMNHPNVVQVFEVGRSGEDYFIAMEFVEGPNLGQLLSKLWRRRQRLPVTAALYITREILAGLDYCHSCTDPAGASLGVVHRDVSPANVLLSYDGAVKLADFGLALSRLKAFQTKPNLVLGHLGYMAPEAMDGIRPDHRADLFGAGVLLFELLTCQRFAHSDDPIVIRQTLRTRSQFRPSEVRGELPPEIDELVARAVAEDPEQRYPTARAFQDAVQKALIRIDALYGGRRLRETVMEPLFESRQKEEELRELVEALDREEVEARQPAARTVCIGEAIPLRSTRRCGFRKAPVLTLIDEPFEGDTQPMETIWTRADRERARSAPAVFEEEEDTLPPVLDTVVERSASRVRRSVFRWRKPRRVRRRPMAHPNRDLTPTPSPEGISWQGRSKAGTAR
jgi:serine/threonine protein kinase